MACAFIIAQIWAYVQTPDSWLAMISGISGILCVVLVSKGKISNYFFGLIFAYTYFYVAWGSNFRRNEHRTFTYICPLNLLVTLCGKPICKIAMVEKA